MSVFATSAPPAAWVRTADGDLLNLAHVREIVTEPSSSALDRALAGGASADDPVPVNLVAYLDDKPFDDAARHLAIDLAHEEAERLMGEIAKMLSTVTFQPAEGEP